MKWKTKNPPQTKNQNNQNAPSVVQRILKEARSSHARAGIVTRGRVVTGGERSHGNVRPMQTQRKKVTFDVEAERDVFLKAQEAMRNRR